jgi:hypothetical protein
VSGAVCPECGEDAVAKPPTNDMTLAQREDQYSHAKDRTPLCPVIGPGGYQSAKGHKRR